MNTRPVVRILFDRHKKASLFNQGAIEVEIYFHHRRNRITLPFTLLKSQWKSGIVVNHPQANEYNVFIQSVCHDLEDEITSMSHTGAYNIEKLCLIVKSKRFAISTTFLEFMKERIDIRDIASRTKRQHRIILNKLSEYGRITHFADFTRQGIKLFDDWLHAQGLCQTTIHGYHKRLKVYVHEAMEFGYLKEDPYIGLRISSGSAKKIKYLLDDERLRIEQLSLSGTDEIVRDMFVFGTYTGLAFSDICKIRENDFYICENRLLLEDCRIKTGTPYKLTMLPPAKRILEKYHFHFPSMTNQTANNHLKVIGELACIRSKLTTHMARHTFATWALRRGVHIETVSKMLAHKSIEQTQVYARVLQASVDDGFDMLEQNLI